MNIHASVVECILCFTALSKGPNRYLVQNKGEFSVQDEISDLDFVVHPTSPYICRGCLRVLQQRRNAKKKLQDLNEKLLSQYRDNATTRGLSIKRKATESRLLSSNDEGDYNSTLTEQNINQTESIATADRSERLQKFHLLISHPRRSPCLFHTNE